MKYILMLFIAFFAISCAHHHDKVEHHHHAYEKACAYSVMTGDLTAKGKDDFQLNHGGKTYYFSSKEKMDKFKAHLSQNIDQADKNWSNRRR